MAREIRVILTDDLDGSEATQSIEFSLKGSTYAIDLNDANAAKLEKALSPFIEKAEKVRAPRGRRRATSRRATKNGTGEVRVWARANGHEVSDRGRIPAEVLAAYEAAH